MINRKSKKITVPYQGQSFADMACLVTFTDDPDLAWGFYGHRLNRYRQDPPHAGFALLRRWGDAVQVEVDPRTFRARAPLPVCPHCGARARPNLLMFYDGDGLDARYAAPQRRFRTGLRTVENRRLAVIEVGAGTRTDRR